MRCIGEINTLEDEGFLRRMTRLSGWLLVACAAVAAAALWLVPFALGVPSPAENPFALGWPATPAWFAAGAAGCFGSLAVHELVHAAFFKLFAPAGTHVSFGAVPEKFMLYASAEGIVYTRRQYQVIAVAPTVVLTVALICAGCAAGWPLLGVLVAVLHLSGCAGDLLYLVDIHESPEARWLEDTPTGVRLYAAGDDSEHAGQKGRPDAADAAGRGEGGSHDGR